MNELLRDIASTLNNLLKHCVSTEFLPKEGEVQGALRKELLIAPFIVRLKAATLGKPY